MRPSDAQARFEQRGAWLIVSLALGLGAFFSLRGLGRVHLFGDEFHSVRNLGLSYGELLRSYDRFGSGLLLPLAQKLCTDLFGPGLLAYRLPAIAGALGSLLLLYPTARLWLRPSPAALATLALAANPIHIFYSRYGRAYSIATCLALAFVYALGCLGERDRSAPPSRRHQALLVLSGGLLPFAHLYAATLGAPVALVALILHVRSGRRWQDLAWPLVAAGALAIALHLPALESLTSFTDDKAFAGSAGPFDALHVGMLLYGCRGSALMAFVGVGLALVFLGRSSPGRAALLGAAALSPGLLLLIARPAGMPFAYARYVLPSLPFQVMLLAWLFDAALERLRPGSPRWRPALTLSIGAALVAVLYVTGPQGNRRAAGGPFANSNLSLCPLPTFDLPWPKVSGFYDLLADSEEELTIIEAPELWNRTALLYRNHWLHHRKDVLSGFVFEKDPSKIPNGFTVDLNAPGALGASGAQYLVLHTNLYRELANYWHFVDRSWKRDSTPELEPLMAAHLSYGMATERLDQLQAMAARLTDALGPPDFEDRQVSVWALP